MATREGIGGGLEGLDRFDALTQEIEEKFSHFHSLLETQRVSLLERVKKMRELYQQHQELSEAIKEVEEIRKATNEMLRMNFNSKEKENTIKMWDHKIAELTGKRTDLDQISIQKFVDNSEEFLDCVKRVRLREIESPPLTQTNDHESHDSEQVYFLTTELNRATADKNEAIHFSETMRVEVRSKNSEIQKLRSDLQASTLLSDQIISNLKKDNTRLKTQNQTHVIQAQTHSNMQKELDKRKTAIDTLKSQNVNYRGQFDTQMQQMKATIDKKEVEISRILQDRDATQDKLNEANASIAELTTNCKKLERQGREAAANNSTLDAALERSLAEKTAALTSLEEKSAISNRLNLN